MSSIDAVANFVSSQNAVEAASAVASRIAQIDPQAASGLIEAVQSGQDGLRAAAEQIASPPTLDGTGSTVDRSV